MYRIISGSKDTYITNKIINNNFRATDSNVGLAGTLDLFKLYDESTSKSDSNPFEISRILIRFDYSDIKDLMNKGKIDINSNSFKAILTMKDIYGGQTTPTNFKLIAMPLAQKFDEGIGRDIINFADIGSSNFLTASFTNGTAVGWNQPGAQASGSLGSSDLDVYISGTLSGPNGSSTVNLSSEQNFISGKEDLSINVTTAVSASLSGQLTNNGFAIAYSGSYEKNEKTYFVKRFGSINSVNVFDRPSLIVKYDDSIMDNNRNFIFNVTGSLFLNNFHRGKKSNILSGAAATPVTGDDSLLLTLKSGSFIKYVTASQHKVGTVSQTGVYSASFAISNFSSSNPNEIRDGSLEEEVKNAGSASFKQIWGSIDGTVGYLTGSLVIESPFRTSFNGSIDRILVTCKNLKSNYRKDDVVKIRVFVENRDEKIIFKKLPVEKKSEVYSEMYYRVIDVINKKIIIPFETIDNATKLSSDSDGMFFVMSMKNLTPGRTYKLEFLIKDFDNDFFINDASGKFIIDN
jgi:hypothetical protein